MKENNKFSVDWKFNAEDVIWNAEQVVGKLPIKYKEERQIYGDWVDVITYKDKEIFIKKEPQYHEYIQRTVGVINKYLPDKTKEFECSEIDGDDLTFTLCSKTD